MPLLAILDQTAFDALPDETVVGKDSYLKDEKANDFKLVMDGEEAGKLAQPLQKKITALEANNAKLLDEKIKTAAKVTAYEKLGKSADEMAEILKAGKTETVEELEKKYQLKEESLKTASLAEIQSAKEAMEAAQTQTGEIERQLESHMLRTKVAELKNKHGINAAGDDYFANRIKVVKNENGEYVTQIVVNGEVKYKGGQLMTPDQLAEETMANKELAGMFNAGIASGSGAPPRQGAGPMSNGFVSALDGDAIGANLEKISTGEIKVV